MAKLNTKKSSQTHRVLVYGAPKTGKTQLAGDLAEHYDLLWIDLENGHETLFKLPESWQKRIELINLPDTRSYPIAIETCLKMVKGPVSICEQHGKVGCMLCVKKEKEVCKEQPKEEHGDIHDSFFTDIDLPHLDHNSVVVFDSLTQLTNSAIASIIKNEPDDYKLTYNDWGNLGKLLDIFLSHIQQAGYNVIVISHETEAETEGKKKTLVPVGGTRNFSRNVAKYFDHVIYAERKNKKHMFASSTQYATNILTGSRTDVCMEEGDKPSLLAIFKPELFTTTKKETKDDSRKLRTAGSNSIAKPSASSVGTKSKTGGESAQEVLARLRNKAKK